MAPSKAVIIRPASERLSKNEEDFNKFFGALQKRKKQMKEATRRQEQLIEWSRENFRLSQKIETTRLNIERLLEESADQEINKLAAESRRLQQLQRQNFQDLREFVRSQSANEQDRLRVQTRLEENIQKLQVDASEAQQSIKQMRHRLKATQNTSLKSPLERLKFDVDAADQNDHVRAAVQQVLSLLMTELKNIDDDFEAQLEELKQQNLTWTALNGIVNCLDDHVNARFEHIIQEHRRALVKGKDHLLHRLRLEFPNMDKAKITLHLEWNRKYHLSKFKQKEIRCTWSRTRDEMIQRFNLEINNIIQEAREKASTSQLQQALSLHKEKIHKKLARLRSEHEQRVLEEQAKQEITKIRGEAKRKRLFKMEKRRRESIKEKLQKCHEQNEAEAEVQRELNYRRRLQELEERKLRATRNCMRVEYRQKCFDQKQKQRSIDEARDEKMQRKKEKRLEQLRSLVRVTSKPDRNRLVQATQAWNYSVSKEVDVPHWNRVNGYNEEQVWSDERFRVNYALREAGLHTSAYAREVIASASTRTAARRDQEHDG